MGSCEQLEMVVGQPGDSRFLTLHPPHDPKGRTGGADPQVLPAGTVWCPARARAVAGGDPGQDRARGLTGGKSWGRPPRPSPSPAPTAERPACPAPRWQCPSGNPWPPSGLLLCPCNLLPPRQRGRTGAPGYAGRSSPPACPLGSGFPAAHLMQALPHPLLWPEHSRNVPDESHNPAANSRAGQARPDQGQLSSRDAETGGAGSEDERGRAAQVKSGPSSYHHSEGNSPESRKKGKVVTSSRKPAWLSNC